MKKTLLTATLAVMTAMAATGANAQSTQNAQNMRSAWFAETPSNAQNTRSERFTEIPSTETTQSVSLDIPGMSLQYAYEHPLGRLTTIVGRVGVDAGVMWGDYVTVGRDGWFHWKHGGLWAVAPSIDIEPRWYYGLDRRAEHGRGTGGNAGSFLALQMKNILPLGYVSDRDLKMYGATSLTPMWGLRRVWGSDWLFEFTTGYSLAWGWRGGFGDSIHLGVRFGYSF